MFEVILYLAAIIFLVFSYVNDRQKTRLALRKAWKSFYSIFPTFAGVLALMGLVLTLFTPDIISGIIGENTGFTGMFITSLVGSVTLIPGFIAFPLASSLLQKGAGIMQIAVFVSTLMMVGILTAPLEIKYLGKKETLLRNCFSYLFSFLVALIIGVVVK